MKQGLMVLLAAAQIAPAARVKELASSEGLWDNQLVGYGLVVENPQRPVAVLKGNGVERGT